jgi:predicted Zn-ribbon and HTH transcriptional regulator
VRQNIAALLRDTEMTARDLSSAAGISEKEVCDHLEHIRRSLRADGKALAMTPPACRSCGYVYADRRRLTRPGRCPRCKATYLSPPSFRIEG